MRKVLKGNGEQGIGKRENGRAPQERKNDRKKGRRICYNTNMRNLRQRWMLWKHKLPDIVVSLFAVLLLTRYAATKPTNQLQNSSIVNHVIYQVHNSEIIKTIDDSSSYMAKFSV